MLSKVKSCTRKKGDHIVSPGDGGIYKQTQINAHWSRPHGVGYSCYTVGLPKFKDYYFKFIKQSFKFLLDKDTMWSSKKDLFAINTLMPFCKSSTKIPNASRTRVSWSGNVLTKEAVVRPGMAWTVSCYLLLSRHSLRQCVRFALYKHLIKAELCQ